MGFGLPDGGDDGQCSGFRFVGISKIFVIQDAFSFRAESFDNKLLVRTSLTLVMQNSCVLFLVHVHLKHSCKQNF